MELICRAEVLLRRGFGSPFYLRPLSDTTSISRLLFSPETLFSLLHISEIFPDTSLHPMSLVNTVEGRKVDCLVLGANSTRSLLLLEPEDRR